MEAVNLNRLVYFASVVDTGSFTKAAERLGITKTVVSQQVSRLEAEFKTSLLVRTTRHVRPTEAGRLLHARCVMILREAEEAVDELAQANAEPRGTLRIAASNDYGLSTVAPAAAAFARRFPACNVDLILSDARADLIADHIDLSIRIGWLDDSSLQAKRVGTFRQFLVASADLAKTITVLEPEQLPAFPFVANGALKDPLVWHFTKGDFDRRVISMRQALSINTTNGVLAATLAGGGLTVLPDFLVTEHFRTGRLVNILPAWTLPSGGIHVVYPAARFRPPKVTTFVAMLVDRIRQSAGGQWLEAK